MSAPHTWWSSLPRFGTWLRIAAILSLLVALLVPACSRSTDDVAVALALDLSASVAAEAMADGLDLAQRIRERGAQLVLVPFADRAIPVASIEEVRALRLIDSSSSTQRAGSWARALDRAATDLEAALLAAAATLPTDRVGNVVLLSDGNPTRGDEKAAASRLSQEGVRIFSVPASTQPRPATLLGARVRGRAIRGLTANLEIDLVTSEAGPVELEHRLGEQPRASQIYDLEPGHNTVELPIRFADEGDTLLSLRLPATNSRWLQTITVEGPRRILLVDGSSTRSPLWGALAERGWQFDRLTPESLPSVANRYDRWQMVVLSDVGGSRVSEVRQRALREWVLAGGNVLFTAGQNTYGEDGWHEGSLEEILPLHFRLEEEEPKVALMIALDKSYSMKGPKITLAKEATKAALGELEDEQLFGLVAFDWNTFDVVPLQEARSREEIERRIDRIEPSAQTNFYPALESSLRQLSATEEEIVVRHVILISDGKTYPDDYEGLLARMRAADITVSTVAVGEEADRELLAQIADWGAGQSYFVRDASRVQRILLDEARQKSDRTLVEETLEVQEGEPSTVFRGIDIGSAPPLRGYQTMEPAEGARILLRIGDDKPLLAVRQSGLGSAWVFASDVTARWSAEWIGWDGWAAMWSQLLADATDSEFYEPESLTVERVGNRFDLEAELRTADGRFIDAATVAVELSGAADPQRIPLRQVAPGRYLGSVELGPSAGAEMRFRLAVGDRLSVSRTLYYPQQDELTPSVADLGRLEQLAELTGGSLDPALDELLAPGNRVARERVPVWPWCLALALVCVLTELVLHRLGRA